MPSPFVLSPGAAEAGLVPPGDLPTLMPADEMHQMAPHLATTASAVPDVVYSAWHHLGGMPERISPQMGATLVRFLKWLPVPPAQLGIEHIEAFSTADLGTGTPDLAVRRLRLHVFAALYAALDALACPLPYRNPLVGYEYPDLTDLPVRPFTDDEAVVVRLASQSTLVSSERPDTLRRLVASLGFAGAHPREIPGVSTTDITADLDVDAGAPLLVGLAGCAGVYRRDLEVAGWSATQIRDDLIARRWAHPSARCPFPERLAYRGAKTDLDAAADSSRGVLTNLLRSSGLRSKTTFTRSGALNPRAKGADLGPSSYHLWAAADAHQRSGDLRLAAYTLGMARQVRNRMDLDTERAAAAILVV